MMEKAFSKSDMAAWDSSGGHSIGKVVKRVTVSMKIQSLTVAASKDNPEYIVRSKKAGVIAAHKPDRLTKK
ncbi:DUF2945 domain-containing protein [soil metagenome]